METSSSPGVRQEFGRSAQSSRIRNRENEHDARLDENRFDTLKVAVLKKMTFPDVHDRFSDGSYKYQELMMKVAASL